MINLSPLIYWCTGENEVVKRARDMYHKFSIPRNPDLIDGKPEKEFFTCNDCVREGNHELYHKDEMMHIEGTTHSGDAVKRYTRHKCKKHAGKYTPHSERLGSWKNY